MLGRAVRLANDANCFALSEASDGAAAGAGTVFGVIAGTGVGGGVVVDGKVLGGAHGIARRMGPHPPARARAWRKWPTAPPLLLRQARLPGNLVQRAGPCRRFQARHADARLTRNRSPHRTAHEERAAMDRLIDRFARALATMVNILDPDVIVLGGGLSNIERLYRDLPPLVEKYAFNLGAPPRIVKNMHGDSSGVRGAAWLWPE